MKRWMAALLLLLLALAPLAALAQEGAPAYAEDITRECGLRPSSNGGKARALRDGDYTTSWRAARLTNSFITITAPKGKSIGGVYIKWWGKAPKWRVSVKNNDDWSDVAHSETGFLSDYLSLPEGVTTCRVRPATGYKSNLRMVEMRVFAPGEPPPEAQRWQPTPERSDIMIISAHPDDEVLFMGGTIPYYAGELHKTVAVMNVVPTSVGRQHELLDCLWLCGLRQYPIFGVMRDNFAMSLQTMYQKWSKAKLYKSVVRAICQCKPDVIVTHDLNGEYGHGAHRASADAATRALRLAENPRKYKDIKKEYGGWQVKKLYLHLYNKNPIVMDWRQPLENFGGRTAFDMAEAGFACHASQQNTEYVVRDDGAYDNRLFGLYYTAVGEDVQKNDFLENVPARE